MERNQKLMSEQILKMDSVENSVKLQVHKVMTNFYVKIEKPTKRNLKNLLGLERPNFFKSLDDNLGYFAKVITISD